MSGGYSGPLLWTLWTVLGAIAVLGGVIAYRALVAFRAHRSTPLLFLGLGLFTISVGMPGLWMGVYFATSNLLWCSLAAAVAIAFGFGLVLVSVQTRRA